MARPAVEVATFDATLEVVSIKRRNLFGVATFDLCVAFENVDALAVAGAGNGSFNGDVFEALPERQKHGTLRVHPERRSLVQK